MYSGAVLVLLSLFLIVSSSPTYLSFQIFCADIGPVIGSAAYTPGNTLSWVPTSAISELAKILVSWIGPYVNNSAPDRRLAITYGPLSMDFDDNSTIAFINWSFSLAKQLNVSVGFHIDTDMWYRNRAGLYDPSNFEWIYPNGTLATSLELDWVPLGAMPPRLCFNCPAVVTAATHYATVVGSAIAAQLETFPLDQFAGVICGSEVHMGRDYPTLQANGFHALSNLGVSTANLTSNIFGNTMKSVVQTYINLWAETVASTGIPTNKIYSHVNFMTNVTFQQLVAAGTVPATFYDYIVNTLPSSIDPYAAFGPDHSPGFSMYTGPGVFEDIQAVTKFQPWAVCEGTNLQPNATYGSQGINMTQYLTQAFGFGATLVNIFAFEDPSNPFPDNPLGATTISPDSLIAYHQFLQGVEYYPVPVDIESTTTTGTLQSTTTTGTLQSTTTTGKDRSTASCVAIPLFVYLVVLILNVI